MTADDSLLPSLDPGESMLLEEQFERLAADVSAGAADKAADIRYTRAFLLEIFYKKPLDSYACQDQSKRNRQNKFTFLHVKNYSKLVQF